MAAPTSQSWVVVAIRCSPELPFSAPTVPGILLKQITEQGANLQDRSQPAEISRRVSCVRCEKEPEARWPTATAAARVESRSAPAVRPSRRPSSSIFGASGTVWAAPGAMSGGGPTGASAAGSRPLPKPDPEASHTTVSRR